MISIGVSRAPRKGCRWLSMKPGSSTLSARLSSTTTSRPSRHGAIEARSPTATMRSSITPTAVASGSDSSMVWMRRAVKMRRVSRVMVRLLDVVVAKRCGSGADALVLWVVPGAELGACRDTAIADADLEARRLQQRRGDRLVPRHVAHAERRADPMAEGARRGDADRPAVGKDRLFVEQQLVFIVEPDLHQ